jgi:hypothetical protein
MLANLVGADGAAQFNAMLDEQLGRLDKPGFLHRLVTEQTRKPLSAEAEAKIDEKDAMFRRMLGTLLISQGFRELPPETQLEPAVQDRMWKHWDQIGSSVYETSDMLAALDAGERDEIQKTLRERPDLPMVLGQTLDDRAASVGISRSRRLQLRSMMSQTSFRLRHGDPASIIEEYSGKIERLRASSERDGDAIDLASKLGEREFWRYQHLIAAREATVATPVRVAQMGVMRPGATSSAGASQTEEKKKPHPGSGGLKAGGYMLGIGLLVGLASALIISAGSFAGVFGLTLAVILCGLGLIVLLISAIIYAASD